MAARRLFGDATVLLNGVLAGTIASRKGMATIDPSPRRTVRLDIFFFVTNIALWFS
jgi:hypothetical protein